MKKSDWSIYADPEDTAVRNLSRWLNSFFPIAYQFTDLNKTGIYYEYK
jgi:hypothetical protein